MDWTNVCFPPLQNRPKSLSTRISTDDVFKSSAWLTDNHIPHFVTDDMAVQVEPLVPVSRASSNEKSSDVASPEREAEKLIEAPLSGFNLARRTSTRYWGWLEAPGNEARLARFGCAMGGSQGFGENGLGRLGGTPVYSNSSQCGDLGSLRRSRLPGITNLCGLPCLSYRTCLPRACSGFLGRGRRGRLWHADQLAC